jgi:TonB family protein
MVLLAFVAQLGLIFWLGGRDPAVPRPHAPVQLLGLVSPAAADHLAVSDPTLFVLPHWRGFSGPAWMRFPQQEFRPFVWSDPPRWEALAPERLGTVFRQFMSTNASLGISPTLALSEPRLKLPELPASAVFPTQSSVRLAGGLSGRQILRTLHLPSWPHSDLLASSQVHVVVDADGRPISATLLATSGKKDADQHALQQAFQARFNPLPGPRSNPWSGLVSGEIRFDWHTLPAKEPSP